MEADSEGLFNGSSARWDEVCLSVRWWEGASVFLTISTVPGPTPGGWAEGAISPPR